jgi:hypothetical protein
MQHQCALGCAWAKAGEFQRIHDQRCLVAGVALAERTIARKHRVLTSIIRQSRAMEKIVQCFSIYLKLMTFGSRRTSLLLQNVPLLLEDTDLSSKPVIFSGEFLILH